MLRDPDSRSGMPLRSAAPRKSGAQRQAYAPFTSTRTQAAPPTTAPPTTARRVVRRATPATLTGVKGRPIRACALSTDRETPPVCDRSTEPATPNATTAAAGNARFRLICFMAILGVPFWRQADMLRGDLQEATRGTDQGRRNRFLSHSARGDAERQHARRDPGI